MSTSFYECQEFPRPVDYSKFQLHPNLRKEIDNAYLNGLISEDTYNMLTKFNNNEIDIDTFQLWKKAIQARRQYEK